ncbi:hemerythrin domain-containing protein [Virgibacillus sp. DJP39]|uniref:hemerythrin domain-containing protein n=1 Tax=Virgibacillus sp. DJP39 TaxID=3409790 RepID=UPI003BB6F6B0
MTKKTGIKRHESLYPLSHHHYHALVIALRLKQVGTEKSKLSLEETTTSLKQFWKDGGQEHFREEEEILLPAYAQYTKIEEQPEISQMLLEHVKIRSMINAVTNMESASVELLQELGVLLETHVRKEERVIFPMIEEALPEEKLKELSAYLHVNYLDSN